MYYNIEVINNLNIYFIVIIMNRIKYMICNDAGILVLKSGPDSHFFPGRVKQAQSWFWDSLKIKSPQQANVGNLSRNTIVYYIVYNI